MTTLNHYRGFALLLFLVIAHLTFGQQYNSPEEQFQGAWYTIYMGPDGTERKVVALVMDRFISETEYHLKDGEMVWSVGGNWTVEDDIFNFNFEFSSMDSSVVGTTLKLKYKFYGDTIRFDGDNRDWLRLDDGSGTLADAWLITGRERDGEMTRRTPGSRKTMKVLTGTRFQWTAYDIDSRSFRGCGGGTYTAENGEYVERIEFFSRDKSRVGAELPFKYELNDGEWHHSGLSSKGQPIHEVWTRRSEVENQ